MLYLAHASHDKQFVDRVTLQLGRHRVVYDKWTFKAGDSLLKAMQQGLGVCPTIRSWRRKPPRNNLLTAIWTLSWSY